MWKRGWREWSRRIGGLEEDERGTEHEQQKHDICRLSGAHKDPGYWRLGSIRHHATATNCRIRIVFSILHRRRGSQQGYAAREDGHRDQQEQRMKENQVSPEEEAWSTDRAPITSTQQRHAEQQPFSLSAQVALRTPKETRIKRQQSRQRQTTQKQRATMTTAKVTKITITKHPPSTHEPSKTNLHYQGSVEVKPIQRGESHQKYWFRFRIKSLNGSRQSDCESRTEDLPAA